VGRQLDAYVDTLEADGALVYYPGRDSSIAKSHDEARELVAGQRDEIASADEVHVWWEPQSFGSHFDLGMAFAMGKPTVLVNKFALPEYPTYFDMIGVDDA